MRSDACYCSIRSMERTLYISDLDGTLLNHEQRVSYFTADIIRSLVDQGVFFSYATARSIVTAAKVTQGLVLRTPAILMNGAFTIDTSNGNILRSHYFTAKESDQIIDCLLRHGIYPLVYAHIGGTEKFSYCPDLINDKVKWFLNTRKNDIRDNPVVSAETLRTGQIFYFSCIDTQEKLHPIYQALQDSYTCIYHRDIYSGDQWLELLPPGVSKASAVLDLKETLGCDRIVTFGDDINDIALFKVSDECYAVENAVPDLKEIATGIIGSNDADGVAMWLRENAIK